MGTGIELQDTFERLNGANVALLVDADVRGGYRVVATLAERDALPSATLVPGCLAYVLETRSTFRRSADGTAWDALDATGSAIVSSAEFYVDSNTGSDSNDGTTPGTALATIAELVRRWGPSPTLSDVIVYIVAADLEPYPSPSLDVTLTGDVEFVDYYAANGIASPYDVPDVTITAITQQVPAAQSTAYVTTTPDPLIEIGLLHFESGHRGWSYFQQTVGGVIRTHLTPPVDDGGWGPVAAGTVIHARRVPTCPFDAIRVRGRGTLGFLALRVDAISIRVDTFASFLATDARVHPSNGSPVALLGEGKFTFDNCFFIGAIISASRMQFNGGGSFDRIVVTRGAYVESLPSRIWGAVSVAGILALNPVQAGGVGYAVTGGVRIAPGGVIVLPASSALFAAPSDSVFTSVPTIALSPGASLLWSAATLGSQLVGYGFAAFVDAGHTIAQPFYALDLSGAAPAFTAARALTVANVDAAVSAGGFGGAPLSLNAGIRLARTDTPAVADAIPMA